MNVRTTVVAVFLLSVPAAPGQNEQKEKPPKKPDWPFTVYVRAAPGDETLETDDLMRGTDELRKKIADKRDWFRVVPNADDAEIVVDVLEHRVREHLTFWASTETIGGETQGVTNSTISRYHSLRARVTMLGSEAELTGMNPKRTGSVKGAASALQKELVELCQERYAMLQKLRSRPR